MRNILRRVLFNFLYNNYSWPININFAATEHNELWHYFSLLSHSFLSRKVFATKHHID